MNWMKLASLVSIAAAPVAGHAAIPAQIGARDACTAAESWTFGAELDAGTVKEFRKLLSGEGSPARGMSEALALKGRNSSNEGQRFAEYWLARSLYKAALVHSSDSGFRLIASRAPTPATAPMQLAALECLNRIRDQHPSVAPDPAVASRLASLATYADSKSSSRRAVTQYAAAWLRSQLAANRPRAEIAATLALIEGSTELETFSRGLVSAHQNDHSGVIKQLGKFVASPGPLRSSINEARMLLARSYYSTGRHDLASAQYRLIDTSSNELAQALSELEWSALQAGRYGEAVGTAVSLQAGGLRRTFAPEAPMVMAMALNELCQYPDSLRAVNLFKRNYEKPYRWLDSWNHAPSTDLYELTVGFLSKRRGQGQGQVPERVAFEWIRSPVFLASQGEMNLLVDEKKAVASVNQAGSQEQKTMGAALVARARALKTKIHAEKSKLKTYSPGTDSLSAPLKAEVEAFRSELAHYHRFQAAAGMWRALAANEETERPRIRKRLVDRVNADLAARNTRMYNQLLEIAENNQMIEVEIFNGAGQDIVWQNAHPDFKAVAAKLMSEQKRAIASGTLNWGTISTSGDVSAEIWEDELNSFKANLGDNCTNKERYLAIKRVTTGRG